MDEPTIQLQLLVDRFLPEQVEPLTGWKRGLIRWTFIILVIGAALGGLGLLLDTLGLTIAGFMLALLAMFPALFAAAVFWADFRERRARPRERAALLAGNYRDVRIVTTKVVIGGGPGSQGVTVDVTANDGRIIVLHCGKYGIGAEQVARTLIAQMSPERRAKYEDEVFRGIVRG